MKSFQCHYYYKPEGSKELVKNGNHACWAGIRNHIEPTPKKPVTIYVDQFKCAETKKYIELLVNIINEITPCAITKDEKYITFELLPTYDQSLVVLNFLRNLWYESVPGYTKSFFECLEELEEGDAMEKLTTANIKACTDTNIAFQGNHCNCHAYNKLKVKNIKSLLSYKGLSTYLFLTT